MIYPLKVSTCLVLCGLLLAGCSDDDDDGGTPVDELSTDSIAACNALAGMTFDAASITLPTLGATVESSALQSAGAENPAAEHCLVTGVIASVDPDAQGIQFALALPSEWNGKTIHAGGGGWNGTTTNPSTPDVADGYAVFGSDGGHQSLAGDAAFGLNAEQLQNFGGDQLKKTRDIAMQLIEARYAQVPTQNYFVGGSNGGRESFAVMQQWPADYDGIVTLFPAFSWTGLFMKLQEIGRSLRADDGAGWFGADKATLLREATLMACDGLDGLEDGLISNREACTFDSSVLLCEAGEDEAGCFTAAQVATVDLMQSRIDLPYTLANGVNSFPGFDIGSDWSGATNTGTIAELNVPPSIPELGAAHWFGDGLVRWLLLADENTDTLTFDPQNPGDLLSRVQQLSEILDHASTDIQAYLDQGGKLMLMHGQSDSLVNTQPTVEYYNDLVARFGQTTIDQAIRFYLVPGFGHGSGLSFTPGLLTQTLFAALDQWVSNSVEPALITLTDMNPATAGRTRPLCEYPSFAQYDGSGDPSLAGSFACIEPSSLNGE